MLRHVISVLCNKFSNIFNYGVCKPSVGIIDTPGIYGVLPSANVSLSFDEQISRDFAGEVIRQIPHPALSRASLQDLVTLCGLRSNLLCHLYCATDDRDITMEVIDKGCSGKGNVPERYEDTKVILSRPGQKVVKKLQLKGSEDKSLFPEHMARKTIEVTRPKGEDKREYKILMECNHENIIKLFYWEIVDNMDHIYLRIYMEYCDQNLRSFLKAHESALTEPHIISLSLQMLRALKYLHEEKKVTHRDIKPENILVNRVDCPSKAILKLADFGLARGVPSASKINTSYAITACGTMLYASPEMLYGIDNHQQVSPRTISAADMFSLGVVIFEMVTQKKPFALDQLRDKSKFDNAFPIQRQFTKKLQWKPPESCPLFQVAVGLEKMLQWNPKNRPSAEEALLILLSVEQFPKVSNIKSPPDGNNLPSLHRAAMNGDTETARFLVESGACNVNSLDSNGMTALHWAAANGRTEVAKILTENGCNINVANRSGIPVLHLAVQNGRLDVVKLLVENRTCSFNLLDRDGMTALHLAAGYDKREMAMLLIENGCNVNVGNEKGVPALLWAAKRGLAEMAQLLISYGCSINVADENNVTALDWAVKNGHTEVVKLLKYYHSTVNVADENNVTALDYAVKNSHSEVHGEAADGALM